MPRMEPIQVWKVELAKEMAAYDVEGSIELAEEALAFLGEEADEPMRIRYDAMVRVKRLRLSPVLVVHWRDTADVRRTAFYLTKPPPLHGGMQKQVHPHEIASDRVRPPSKRTQMRRNSYYLTLTASEVKPTLVAWVRAIKQRMASAGTATG
jgi:hypothetical protein